MHPLLREMLKQQQMGTSFPAAAPAAQDTPGRAQVPDWVKRVSTPLPMQVMGGIMNTPAEIPNNIWSTTSPIQNQRPNVMTSASFPQYDEEINLSIDTEDIINSLDEGDVKNAEEIQKNAKERLDNLKGNEEVDQDWLTEQELLIDTIIERYELHNIVSNK